MPPPIPKPGYRVFIGLLAVLSIINLVIAYLPGMPEGAQQIARFMEAPLTAVFLFDFFRHLALSHPRRRTSSRTRLDRPAGQPADHLPSPAALPTGADLAAAANLPLRDIVRTIRRDRAATALQLVLVSDARGRRVRGHACLDLRAATPGANITTGGDAIWWAFVSITTVGYGDKYPITIGRRATAVVMLWSGVALIGVLSAYLANLFLRPTADDVAFAAA